MLATKRRLVGRKIVDVRLRRFAAGGGRGWTYDPVLVLDNGATVTFTVDELESASDYGITPNYYLPAAASPPATSRARARRPRTAAAKRSP